MNAVGTPRPKARTTMCQGFTAPVNVRTARTQASAIMLVWVARRRRRLATRSATTPPYRTKSHDGMPAANPT
jgi:hypothetical protein